MRKQTEVNVFKKYFTKMNHTESRREYHIIIKSLLMLFEMDEKVQYF